MAYLYPFKFIESITTPPVVEWDSAILTFSKFFKAENPDGVLSEYNKIRFLDYGGDYKILYENTVTDEGNPVTAWSKPKSGGTGAWTTDGMRTIIFPPDLNLTLTDGFLTTFAGPPGATEPDVTSQDSLPTDIYNWIVDESSYVIPQGAYKFNDSLTTPPGELYQDLWFYTDLFRTQGPRYCNAFRTYYYQSGAYWQTEYVEDGMGELTGYYVSPTQSYWYNEYAQYIKLESTQEIGGPGAQRPNWIPWFWANIEEIGIIPAGTYLFDGVVNVAPFSSQDIAFLSDNTEFVGMDAAKGPRNWVLTYRDDSGAGTRVCVGRSSSLPGSWTDGKWRTITVTTDQVVTAEFYEWFFANAQIEPDEYNIVVSSVGLTATASAESAAEGTEITVTFSDFQTRYTYPVRATLNGALIGTYQTGTTSFTFDMPATEAAVTVAATYENEITVSGVGVTASADKQYAAEGTEVTVNFSGFSQYYTYPVSATLNGEPIGTYQTGTTSFTFDMPATAAAVQVAATYAPPPPSYDITFTANGFSSATISAESATEGSTVEITFAVGAGYKYPVTLTVNDELINAYTSGSVASFDMPGGPANVVLNATAVQARITVGLYKDIPISRDYSVVWVPTSMTKAGRIAELSPKNICSITGNDASNKWTFLPTQGKIILDLQGQAASAFLSALTEANYMYVGIEEGQKEYFCFVDSVDYIQQKTEGSQIVCVYFSIDYWNTYALRADPSGAISFPKTYGAHIIRGNCGELITERTEIPSDLPSQTPSAEAQKLTVTTILSQKTQLTAVCTYVSSEGLILNIARQCTSYADAVDKVTKLQVSTQYKYFLVDGVVATANITPLKAFIVPSEWVTYIVSDTAYYDINVGTWNYPIQADGWTGEKWGTVESFEKSYVVQIQSWAENIVMVGTFRHRFQPKLKFFETVAGGFVSAAGATAQIRIVCTVSDNGLTISMCDEYDDYNPIDITEDLSVPVQYSAAAQYFAQKGISTALSMLGNIAAIGGSVATGNPLGAMQGAPSIVSQAVNMAEIRKTRGVTVSGGDFDNIYDASDGNIFGTWQTVAGAGADAVNEYGILLNYIQPDNDVSDVIFDAINYDGMFVAGDIPIVFGCPHDAVDAIRTAFSSGIKIRKTIP